MGEHKRRQMRHDEMERLLAAGNRAEMRAVIDELTRHLADSGRLIEAGWLSLKVMAIPDDAPPVQIQEMRNAYYSGAQHLFASIMSMLDEGEEPTEKDLSRLDKIKAELDGFVEDFKLKNFEAAGSA